MPLDTSIPLQAVNAGDVANKDIAQFQQAQAARQQLQLQQYGVAQAKSDFEDQQNMKAAWRQASGDPTKTLAVAAQLGVSPKAVLAFQSQQAELRTKLDAHQKAVDEHGKSQLDQMNERNSQIQAGLEPLLTAKDDVDFHTKLPGVIQSLKNNSLITDDEVALLSKAPNQQAVQDWSFGHNNVDILSKQMKIKSDAETAAAATSRATTEADKQARLAASQIETSAQATLQGAGRELTNSLSGGPVAYQRTLEKLVADDKTGLVAKNFPSGAQVSTMTPAAVKSAIDQGTMTGKDRQAADQAAATLANQKAFQEQEIKLRQQSNSIQQKMLGLDQAKTAAALFSAGLDSQGKPLAGEDKALLTPNLQNTSDGRNFIDQDSAMKGLPKGQQLQLKQAAAHAGVVMLSAKDAGALKDTDNARNTINNVFDTFMKNGASSVMARPFKDFRNTVDTITGINPKLDAANKNFLASIEGMKAAGGQGSGLRITGAEINKIGEMRPHLGDTKEMIASKLQQFNNLINDKLNANLHTVAVTRATDPSDLKSMSTEDLFKQLGGK